MGPIRSRMTLTYPPRNDYISMLPPLQNYGGLDVPERTLSFSQDVPIFYYLTAQKAIGTPDFARYILSFS